MNVEKIVVVGAGAMGSGIAQTAAIAGYQVAMTDVIPEAIARARTIIARSADKLAAKGVITEAQKQAAQGIQTGGDLEPARQADLVIEAATENPDLKLQLFNDLDRIAPPQAILASNTSSISLTRIASATTRPEKVIGMHFFNPVPLMKLVEVISGLHTAPAVAASVSRTAWTSHAARCGTSKRRSGRSCSPRRCCASSRACRARGPNPSSSGSTPIRRRTSRPSSHTSWCTRRRSPGPPPPCAFAATRPRPRARYAGPGPSMPVARAGRPEPES